MSWQGSILLWENSSWHNPWRMMERRRLYDHKESSGNEEMAGFIEGAGSTRVVVPIRKDMWLCQNHSTFLLSSSISLLGLLSSVTRRSMVAVNTVNPWLSLARELQVFTVTKGLQSMKFDSLWLMSWLVMCVLLRFIFYLLINSIEDLVQLNNRCLWFPSSISDTANLLSLNL